MDPGFVLEKSIPGSLVDPRQCPSDNQHSDTHRRYHPRRHMRWAIFHSPILVSLETNKPFLSKATFTFSQLTHLALQLLKKIKGKNTNPSRISMFSL